MNKWNANVYSLIGLYTRNKTTDVFVIAYLSWRDQLFSQEILLLLYLYCFNKAIEFIFAGTNIFWARLRFIFFFLTLRRAQNIYMPKNKNSVTIIITLKAIEKIKTEKNDNETVWTITRAFTSWMAFIFPQWKYTIHQGNLVRNYEVLPFEFSKIVEDMKGKFHKAYL